MNFSVGATRSGQACYVFPARQMTVAYEPNGPRLQAIESPINEKQRDR